MVKAKKGFKFIKNFNEAKRMIKKLFRIGFDCHYASEHAIDFSINARSTEGYCVKIDGMFGGVICNDYDVIGICPNATEYLRELQADKNGKEYIDGLEEYLNNKTKAEIAKLRRVYENEVE